MSKKTYSKRLVTSIYKGLDTPEDEICHEELDELEAMDGVTTLGKLTRQLLKQHLLERRRNLIEHYENELKRLRNLGT